MGFLTSAKRIAALRHGPIARGAIVGIAVRVAALGLGFSQAILIARLLGPEGLGITSICASIAGIAASLAMLGLGPFAVREIASRTASSDWSRVRGYVHFSIVSVLTVSLFGAALLSVVVMASGVVEPQLRPTMTVAAALVPLIALLALLRGICQGFGRVAAAVIPNDLVRPMIYTAALAVLFSASMPASPTGVLLLLLAANATALIVAGRNLRKIMTDRVPAAPRVTESVAWRRSAMPFFGLAVIGLVQGEINTLLLGWLSGAGAAGLFQPLARLTPVMVIGAEALAIRYAPRVAELTTAENNTQLRDITRLFTIVSTLATTVTGAALLVLAPWILGAFGKAFSDNVPALIVLAGAQVVNAACGPVGMLLLMTGRQMDAMLGQGIGLAVNVVLGLLIIPEHGVRGAALAMAGGIVAWNLAMLIIVRRRLGFDPSLPGSIRSAMVSGGRRDSQT